MCRRSDHTQFTAVGNADCKAIFESFVIVKKCVSKSNFCVSLCVVKTDLPMLKPLNCTQNCVSRRIEVN